VCCVVVWWFCSVTVFVIMCYQVCVVVCSFRVFGVWVCLCVFVWVLVGVSWC